MKGSDNDRTAKPPGIININGFNAEAAKKITDLSNKGNVIEILIKIRESALKGHSSLDIKRPFKGDEYKTLIEKGFTINKCSTSTAIRDGIHYRITW